MPSIRRVGRKIKQTLERHCSIRNTTSTREGSASSGNQDETFAGSPVDTASGDATSDPDFILLIEPNAMNATPLARMNGGFGLDEGGAPSTIPSAIYASRSPYRTLDPAVETYEQLRAGPDNNLHRPMSRLTTLPSRCGEEWLHISPSPGSFTNTSLDYQGVGPQDQTGAHPSIPKTTTPLHSSFTSRHSTLYDFGASPTTVMSGHLLPAPSLPTADPVGMKPNDDRIPREGQCIMPSPSSNSPLSGRVPALYGPPQSPSGESSYFTNASAFSIGQVNTRTVHKYGSSKTIFEYLEPHISHGAAFNSSERCDAPNCDPETRRAIQEDIVGWMRDGDVAAPSRKIMWLAGPAGCGKTAIAGSVAETCGEAGLLAASFFFSSFSRSANRHSKRCVVATIALHIAEHESMHEYKAHLLASIHRNPTIFRKRLIDQAQALILQPLQAIQRQIDYSTWPKSILFDGLDEVLVDLDHEVKPDRFGRTDEDDQLEILNVLLVLARDSAFPFRIFISSRPERAIEEFFATTAHDMTIKLFLDSKYDPDADIERFLHSKFASIRRRYGILNVSWPGEQAIGRIIEMSSGQFIVPATIVRHIAAGVPQRQLDDIMQLKWEESGRSNPFAVVDALYTCILRRSPDPCLAAKWIRVYTSARQAATALFFKQFVEDVEGEFQHVLGPLSSLVSIPTFKRSTLSLVVYHKYSISAYPRWRLLWQGDVLVCLDRRVPLSLSIVHPEG